VLDALLARALPGCARAERDALAADGAASVEGRVLREGGARLAPGVRVELEVAAPGAEVERSLADPPSACHDRPLPDGEGWLALVPALPWRQGRLEARAGTGSVAFRVTETRRRVALVVLEPSGLSPLALRRLLAEAGAPVLGDARFGGRLVEGGLRLAAAAPGIGVDGRGRPAAPAAGWPAEPALPRDVEDDPSSVLEVSGATLRALARGHPWVLRDAETGDPGRFAPGTRVGLAARGHPPGAIAVVEGEGQLVARLWERAGAGSRAGPRAGHPRRPASVAARVERALEARRAFREAASEPDGSDAFRLVHGEADGLPGIAVDRLGPMIRILASGGAGAALCDAVCDAVRAGLGAELGADPPVVAVLQLPAPRGALECVRLLRGRLPEDVATGRARCWLREGALHFPFDPGLATPTVASPTVGFFLDQRANRRRAARRAGGGAWLNLFAHTGAFSAVLLAGGAAEVLSVDLSAAWLRWLDETLERNDLADGRHRSQRGDARHVLERMPAGRRFHGIVIDPPTAAAAGRRFWAVRRDLEPLLEQAFRHLVPGGALLVCRNDRGGARGLAGAVGRAAERAGVELARSEEAGPDADFPSLPGFAEDPYHGLWVRTAVAGGRRGPGPGPGPEQGRRPGDGLAAPRPGRSRRSRRGRRRRPGG